MPSPLRILLILDGITGIWGIFTVSKVSLKTGDSLEIPCFYETRYRNNVKYLCEGYYWRSCSPVIKTNQSQTSKKYLILDDEKENIFTVTIKDLKRENAYYWCVVEINNGGDVGEFFELSITNDKPRLYVERQHISGFRGESLTVNCLSNSQEKFNWCRMKDKCETKTSGTFNEAKHTPDRGIQTLSVTMTGLKLEDNGWYWFIQGDTQFPVHLTVIEKSTPAPSTTERGVITNNHDPTQTRVQLQMGLTNIIIPLSLLVLAVTTVLVIWLILRNRQAKRKSTAEQLKHVGESDEDVTYSSVVARSRQGVKQHETDENVTYSTLGDCQVHI